MYRYARAEVSKAARSRQPRRRGEGESESVGVGAVEMGPRVAQVQATADVRRPINGAPGVWVSLFSRRVRGNVWGHSGKTKCRLTFGSLLQGRGDGHMHCTSTLFWALKWLRMTSRERARHDAMNKPPSALVACSHSRRDPDW
jgi:hypothetical protein